MNRLTKNEQLVLVVVLLLLMLGLGVKWYRAGQGTVPLPATPKAAEAAKAK